MTSEITAEEAASRFPADGIGLEGLTRLGDAELHALLVGNELRLPRGMPHRNQEFLGSNGVLSYFSYGWRRHRYVIVVDALCVEDRQDGWRCRRFYRNGEGDLFQVQEGSRSLLSPVVVHRAIGP